VFWLLSDMLKALTELSWFSAEWRGWGKRRNEQRQTRYEGRKGKRDDRSKCTPQLS